MNFHIPVFSFNTNPVNKIIIPTGCKLPNDLRCSLRIHNGQRLVSSGLIGSMAISNHYQSESLLELSVASGGLQKRDGLHNCIPVSFCVNTGNGQFMALTDEEGHTPGEIFWPSPDRSIDNFEISTMTMHHFLGGNNFASWLCTYADQLSRNCYPVMDNEIYKFLFSDSATTDDIKVTTTTAFLPELSSVKPPLFFFTYRISISMDTEASMVSVKMHKGRFTRCDFAACSKLTADLWLSCTSQKMSYDFKSCFKTLRQL